MHVRYVRRELVSGREEELADVVLHAVHAHMGHIHTGGSWVRVSHVLASDYQVASSILFVE